MLRWNFVVTFGVHSHSLLQEVISLSHQVELGWSNFFGVFLVPHQGEEMLAHVSSENIHARLAQGRVGLHVVSISG